MRARRVGREEERAFLSRERQRMKVELMPMALPGTTEDDDGVWSTETLTWAVGGGREEVEVGGLSEEEVFVSWTMSCCNSVSVTFSDLNWCCGWSL